MPEPLTDPQRLDLLEQMQYLHDAAERRHREGLARHEEQLGLLRLLLVRQVDTQRSLAETLAAIRDLLERDHGHA